MDNTFAKKGLVTVVSRSGGSPFFYNKTNWDSRAIPFMWVAEGGIWWNVRRYWHGKRVQYVVGSCWFRRCGRGSFCGFFGGR